ncbi:DUF3703 domain-containing protein [Methylosarcina fibrata]|uniref:DUF3703 domain-containing protein n=1 Tax=Methylosarcina fibrata TaxID=105972 RepID=UPI000477E927|nr:DUF3703 domain-containing protein [Methylosarcina fibrata]
MNTFGQHICPYVDAELRAAVEAEAQGRAEEAFACLERAHVLGQASTVQHVRVHWRMFAWGWRRRNVRECFGQLLRIVGAALLTAAGLVPEGNTGGSGISPFKPLPVAPELQTILQRVRSQMR